MGSSYGERERERDWACKMHFNSTRTRRDVDDNCQLNNTEYFFPSHQQRASGSHAKYATLSLCCCVWLKNHKNPNNFFQFVSWAIRDSTINAHIRAVFWVCSAQNHTYIIIYHCLRDFLNIFQRQNTLWRILHTLKRSTSDSHHLTHSRSLPFAPWTC